jgi:hypothetical protein
MPDNEEVINEFMLMENKKALGEKVKKTSVSSDDNFLSDGKNILNRFSATDNSTSPIEDKSYLIIKKTLNFIVTVPILIGGAFSFFYIIMKIWPLFFSFLRKIFIGLWMK